MTVSGEARVGDLSGPGVRIDLVYESERTRVTRLVAADGGASVIRKEPLGARAHRRVRQERAILERLAGVAGIVQLAGVPPLPGSILLGDVHGEALSRTAMPLELKELTRLAIDLARAVAGLHHRGVVHRDVNPANIVVARSDSAPSLIGFGLATSFAEIRPSFTHHNEIVGTLAYLAPEQTGRTDRPVDQRADLYGLGATLYEFATGAPPFGTGDPLRLSHDHLARVPTPPAQVNCDIPPALSDIIMHLLEKEPDKRYQTADGLVYDLIQVREGRSFRVGERDFPLRLLPPSRLIGRDAEVAALGAAFARSLTGRCRGLLVTGVPGVGKTTLLGELRPIVTASGGWFVAGKFDSQGQDPEFDAVHQVFRALGRLLLAEPEEELAQVRARIMRAIGPHAGLVTAVNPEFATLLGVAPDATGDDPLVSTIRLQQVGLELLRALASPTRPVVLVVDDLQWAGRTPLGFVDAVLSDEHLEGVFLVAAYREDEVDAAHPLTAMLSRWHCLDTAPERIRLDNLPTTSLVTLLSDMLHVDVTEAEDLAEAIGPRTRGNPYDTVELVNALRRDGVLVPGTEGWHWERSTLRHQVGRTDVIDLLVARTATMPRRTQDLLETMACLGGRVDVGLLRAATDLSPAVVEGRLRPALEDGLLVLEPGRDGDSVRFRHDRVQEAVRGRLSPGREHGVRLDLARRLSDRPELAAIAAAQYDHVIDAVRDPDERRQALAVFRRATDQALLLSNCAVVEHLMAGALRLVDPADTDTVVELETCRQAALYSLGRLDEADDAYRRIDRLCGHSLQRADATVVQVSSLTNRGRPREAMTLGLDLLRQFGTAVPSPGELPDEIEHGLEVLHRWVDEGDGVIGAGLPEITDQVPPAKTRLLNRLMAPALFCDQPMMNWLALEAVRMWERYGPSPSLVGPVAHVGLVTAALRRDHLTGRRALRRLVAAGEARGYEPDTSWARYLYSLGTGHWFEPLEENVLLAQRAREGLIQGGDLQNACFTYSIPVQQFLDCAPSLVSYIGEVDSALAFAARTGNDYAAETYRAYRWAAAQLRGENIESSAQPDARVDQQADDLVHAPNAHITHALVAALFDDQPGLASHTAAAMPLLRFIEGTYPTALGYLLRALALAERVRLAAANERARLISELDTVLDWMASRAEVAAGNFLHLQRLIEAERAWALGDFWGAARAFDAAQRVVETRQRPWHRALIIERAARFHLACGTEHVGHVLLGEARQAYEAWGASAKVAELDRAFPMLQPRAKPQPVGHDHAPAASITTGTIDLLGILDASRALSSETNMDRLRARVVDVLSAMTGATRVHLVLWNDDERTWLLSSSEAGAVRIDDPGARWLVPLSAIRYAERTREPLVVTDATQDDRFARDPYLAGLDNCSLLVVPITNRGVLRALLLLENRLIRGAFSAEHLDGVMLIAGQLGVALDNALVYASLERKVAKRTEALAEANERLERLSITDSLTGLANRRRLEVVLDAEWRRAQRAGVSLGLAMVDVDCFKLYNDYFGHPAGDDCLQHVATVLKNNIRKIDLVARYGGEEFAVVMPGADIVAASGSAERLVAAVAELGEPHPMVACGTVTVSIGVAAMVPSVGSLADLIIELADAELYRAKRGGRNRVMAAQPT